jgi:hypothetical protein
VTTPVTQTVTPKPETVAPSTTSGSVTAPAVVIEEKKPEVTTSHAAVPQPAGSPR